MVVSNDRIVLSNHTKLLAGAGPRLAQKAVKAVKSCSKVARADESCQRLLDSQKVAQN